MNQYKKHIIIIILSLFVISLKAQNSLKIYDAKTLELMAFATVRISNSENNNYNTTSDEVGIVEIPSKFKKSISLVVSYIGYQTLYKTIQINRTNSIYIFPYEKEIDAVVVTASTSNSTSKKNTFKVDIIDKVEIENKAANNLGDALLNNTNVEIQHSVLGTSINLQGLSGANVKIMIDGVPVIGRLNGEIDLSQINMNNIERIEIVEGPLSVIYGSNALAGVVNLITKKSQKKKIEGNLNTYYESIGTYNANATIGLKIKNHFIQLSGGRNFFDGWNDGKYDRDLSWDPKETYFADVTYVLRTKQNWFHRIKGSYFEDRLLDRKNPNGPFTKATDQWFKTRRIDGAYIVNGSYKENYYIQSTNSYNNYKRIKNTFTKDLSDLTSIIKDNSEYNIYQDTTSLQQMNSRTFVAYNKKDEMINYQVGYDLNIENGKGQKFKAKDDKSITMVDIAAFVSVTIRPVDKLTIQPAMRFGFNSKFKSEPTFSTSVKYDISNNVIYRLSYGMGYRAPSLKELYLDFQNINHNITGNEELKSERSHNVSTSLEYSNTNKIHKYNFKINGFFNHKYDGIFLSQVSGNDKNAYTYINTVKYQTLGTQFDFKYKFKHFSLSTGFSLIGTYNIEYENNNNLDEFFVKPALNLNLNYDIKKLGLKISVFNKYIGSSSDYNVDENGIIKPVTLEAYDILDFTISKTFWKKKIKIATGVKNIFNVMKINEGLNSGGIHSSDSGTEISTGRSYFLGLKFSI